MKKLLVLGAVFLLSACGTSDADTTEETDSSEETAQTEETEANTEDTETEEDTKESTEVDISIESVMDEEEGTMLDASDEELQEELTAYIEEEGPDNVTNEMIYTKLVEMLGGHPDVQGGIEYYMNYSSDLVDLTDQPGGLKVEDGEISLNNNVYILMDNSGSMADEVQGMTKIDAAKESINQVVEDLPNGTQVSLINYGFEVESDEPNAACTAVEETYPVGEYDEAVFSDAMGEYGSEGHTPLALAIEEVGKVIEASEETGSHTVYVVSDGQETCNGDPVEAVDQLPKDENVETVLNIVGFDIKDDEVQALVDITEASGGEYLSATNPEELTEVLDQA